MLPALAAYGKGQSGEAGYKNRIRQSVGICEELPYILAAVLYGGYQDISLSLATGKRLCHNRTGLCVRPESR